MIRRLIAAAAIILAALFAATPASANHRVIYGEFQTVGNVTPPTRLDIMLYNGNLNGLNIYQRCANKGGSHVGWEYWQGAWRPVCYDVDY